MVFGEQWGSSAVGTKDLHLLNQWEMIQGDWTWLFTPGCSVSGARSGSSWVQFSGRGMKKIPLSPLKSSLMLLFPSQSQDQMRRINPQEGKTSLLPALALQSIFLMGQELCAVSCSQLLGGEALTQDCLVFPVSS